MKLYEVVLPIVVLAVIAFAVRWQFHRVVDEAVSGNPTIAIPAVTPISGPLCGFDSRNCKNLQLQPYFNMR